MFGHDTQSHRAFVKGQVKMGEAPLKYISPCVDNISPYSGEGDRVIKKNLKGKV